MNKNWFFTNKTWMFKIVLVLIALVAVAGFRVFTYGSNQASFGLINSAEAAPLRPLTPEECVQIASMRSAALRHDASQVPAMLAVLTSTEHPHPAVIQTALYGLAELGAVQALPQIDVLEQNHVVEPNCLQAARQRLIAENAASNDVTTQAQADDKIRSLYTGLHLSVAAINSRLASNPNLAPSSSTAMSQSGKTLPIETYALREVADMAYHGNYANYAKYLSSLNFQSDYPSALKVRLAPLSRADRVKALIQDLATTKYRGVQQNYEIQLADDEGSFAANLATAQLKEMDSHPADYPEEGFDTLFAVLSGAGDPSQAPVVEQFTHDPNGYIAYYAKDALFGVKNGDHTILAPDY